MKVLATSSPRSPRTIVSVGAVVVAVGIRFKVSPSLLSQFLIEKEFSISGAGLATGIEAAFLFCSGKRGTNVSPLDE